MQFIFALLVSIVIQLPSPEFWVHNDAYLTVFGSILRFVLAGTIANIVSNFTNIYLISKLKIPMEGKLFWVRSILSTMISGFILVAIIVVVGFTGNDIDYTQSWIMFKSTYACEVIYAFLLVIPAALVANFLKNSEKVDVYDYETNFNPFLLNKI